MKRQKRDMVQRAFSQGLKAGMRGHSTEFCPYIDNVVHRGAWMNGWRSGRDLFWAGVSILHSRTQTPHLD